MHSAILNMLEKYNCTKTDDYVNALKEIIQEIALLGLYRANFFDKAAFYGGTALRIFYNLDRFSEDLDFSLLKPDSSFDIIPYCNAIENELIAFGFDVNVERKTKSFSTNIESAFIKGETLIQLINIGLKKDIFSSIPVNQKLKIKLEIDIAPPGNPETEIKYSLQPIPFHVRIFTPSSLMAGKVHALLCREWGGGRVKGRDIYDYIWYLSKGISLDLIHLIDRMVQTEHLEKSEQIRKKDLINLLNKKFDSINYNQAQRDVLPFVSDINSVEIWSSDFLKSITEAKLKIK